MEKGKTGVVEYVETQILRVDGKDCFMEMLFSAYGIGKVQINFISYDSSKGNKMTSNIPIYISIPKFLVLCNDILSGKINALGKREKARAQKLAEDEKKTVYPSHIYQDLGGVTSFRVKAQKKKYSFEIPDGYAVSRAFLITPGMKADWMLSGQMGLGKESDKGLIVPQGRPKELVRIPMDNDTLKSFALVGKMHLEAYYAAFHTKLAMKEEIKKQVELITKQGATK